MRKIITKLLLATTMCLSSLSILAQGENPFVGTWDINISASDFGGAPAPANMSRTYADLGDGSYIYMVATVNQDSTLSGSSATYRYDGGQYPIASLTPGAQAKISYRRLNDRTIEYRVHVEDILTQIGAKTISPDGRVLRIAIQFPSAQGSQNNQILEFDRRR